MPARYPIILALISVFLFSACQKGEDDPKISLRTRKARVAGEWRLTEGNLVIGTTDITNGLRYNQVYDFNGSNYTMTETSQGLTPAVSSGAYLLNITFDKKGNFSLTEQMKLKKLNASGTWDFNAGLGSEKKKEKLVIALKDVSASKTPGYHLFNQNSTKFIYTIKELRNKRMALKAELPIYIDADGSEQTFYGEFVFIQ